MALLTQRDPMVVGAALARWITARTGVHDVRVINAEHPAVDWVREMYRHRGRSAATRM